MLTVKEQKKAIHQIGWNIKRMSFIIGAGFSKNVSDHYLSWWELMQDMVHQMFGAEMAAHKMSVGDIIDKYGYLGVASEYVRRKGYHEAIDEYIEKRTPVLVENKKTGSFDLYLNGKLCEKNVDTSLQRTLLDLMPNNIYTFNYDNAFECNKSKVHLPFKNADPQKEHESSELNDVYFNSLDKLETSIDNALEEIEKDKTSNKNDSLNKEDYYIKLDNAINLYNTGVEDRLTNFIELMRIDRKTDIKSTLSNNRRRLKNIKDELDVELSYHRNNVDTFWLIRNGSEISLSGYGNAIYKLHGSIRDFDVSTGKFHGKYGFDADSHVQYIISKEDYDAYSKKHEPFVDLMRISLLKESFCIIGFSCDDPNFLLWINWVKDVLERKNDGEKDIRKKFYINVEDEHLPEDKTLLLNTHYIDIINLSELYPNANTRKERLIEFFRDLQYQGYESFSLKFRK